MNNKIDTSLNEAIEAMNQAIIPISNKEIVSKPVIAIEPADKKRGRPTIMSQEMQERIIALAEEYFFIRSIAGEAGISYKTIERYLSEEGNKEFVLSFTHARDKWIADKQRKLEAFALDKKTSDWRAMQYLLTIADKEYSERKYLTEAVANQDAKILMLIKAEKLTIASQQGQEMLKTVINTPLQGQEKISLLPFEPEDPKNKGKAKTLKNKGKNGSRTPSQ